VYQGYWERGRLHGVIISDLILIFWNFFRGLRNRSCFLRSGSVSKLLDAH
jgi:hypothetical protein